MSWLNEGPLSRINNSQDNYALQGARAGAAGGPLGVAAGALAGWLYSRYQQGQQQGLVQRGIDMAGSMSDRVGQGINWNASPNSPLSQFNNAPTGNIGDSLGITDWGSDKPGTALGAGGQTAAPSTGGGGYASGMNWGGGFNGSMLSNLGMASGVMNFGGFGGSPTNMNNLDLNYLPG